ncbi:UDP-Glycosyltransferase/glycogen phosphorylase [Lojkania enalia]|uniref:UDP-Glycosyltransferase/glycogen phosphorylase n=1 Tax=Lojkania enalia TaxID=147567 RepID=A0A9P4K0S7_9PLEO|nr:UDP-Glycosyltransferase/glycogen phosphorylase [Didymosphaeria enalia]
MADDRNHEGLAVVLTAMPLGEPRFPNGTTFKPHSSDGGACPAGTLTIDTPRNDTVDPSAPPLVRGETDIAAHPPPSMIKRSATEGLLPTHRSMRLGRKCSSTARPPQLERQATVSFDPYSSESSSSSNEDEPSRPQEVDGEASNVHQREQTRSHRFHAGPFSMFQIANEHFHSKGRVSKQDGRLKLSINETVNSGYFAKTLGAGLKKHLKVDEELDTTVSPVFAQDAIVDKIPPENDMMEDLKTRVKLNIVVIVIGSRGDIQPFLKIGKILKEEYGHRVRIATHPAFKNFVEEDSDLEFFSVGGNPSELMAFMVKNPGLIPSVETIKEGEIGRKRAAMYEMFEGMWRACVNSTDDESDKANLKMMGKKHPFVADAIIANPPSFAPPHIAERLGIPLHMMFTFPYSPTVQFPHPLANIKASNVDSNYTNFMSYPLVEMMTWQGLGDLINRFRYKTLCLEEVSTLWAPGQLFRLKVPHTYLWSPGLVPKPQDWGPEIDIAGFVFLDLASSFKPPESLLEFLKDGPAPIYIGFGSIVVDNPERFTKMIFDAVKMAGVRALVSEGWGGLGDRDNTPDNIYMLDNMPHDWLFPRVRAVVHHGGAGTTAIGLKCGKPTMIVPFFGDQPFWGGMVSKARAGAHECIPYKKLTTERLAEGIKQCLTNEAKRNAQKIADSIAKEGDGALNAVRSFHRSLPLRGEHNMRCQLLENRVACWTLKNTNLHLCPLAAELLVEWKKVKWNELRLLRHYEWNDFGGPGEPLTGLWGAIVGTASNFATGVGLVPVNMAKSVKKREKYYEKRWKIKRRQKHSKETPATVNTATTNGAVSVPNQNKPAQKNRLEPPERQETTLSRLSDPKDYLAEELAQEAGHGFKKSALAIVRLPMEITIALTQGFHNAPRLYGDDTVRRPRRITGFRSGLRAGRDEFIFGIKDGVSGLWMQPYRRARDGGVTGFFLGIGMGIGGFVLKDIAAFLGPSAYTMKGVYEESVKKYQPTNYLRRARIAQGRVEIDDLGLRKKRNLGVPNNEEAGQVMHQQIEAEVARKWEQLHASIIAEQKNHHTGIRASLFGRSNHKEGATVPRKQPRSSLEGGLKTASSAPIDQAQKFELPTRSDTAPGSSMGWKEKGVGKKKYRMHNVPSVVREEAKNDGVKSHAVPNVFGASLQSQGKLATSTRGHDHDANLNFVTPPETQDDIIEKRLGEGIGDERARATSDITDWATIRKLAKDANRSRSHVV